VSDRYLGKFEGVVVDNKDPDGLCRLEISVPALMAETFRNCRPALPYAGPGSGLAAVPPIGASVWVEWPGGDLGKDAIWTGAWWPSGQEGVPGAGPNTLVLFTPGHQRIELSDETGSITLSTHGGASISIGKDSIVLKNGQGATIELNGSTIALNDNAFQVNGDG
jgi:uncharacterized protein involved in type VI secretion and phage assembly